MPDFDTGSSLPQAAPGESTKKLMVGFYANLRQGMPVETALQEAQRALMKTKETDHPFFWAGFVAVRGPE